VDLAIPFPLEADDVAELQFDAETAQRVAMERAVERGRHLVNVRYMCTACHGKNLGGGVMIDAFPIGSLLGPNLTRGPGSRTLDYVAAHWDRAVRHGILPDGRPSIMPSEDYRLMSDQELSDIVAYIQSVPPVDNTVPAPALGPLGKVLLATGELRLSAVAIESHQAPHQRLPPPEAKTLEFGAHLAGTCTGCHRRDLSGGPIAGGDPSWPPAKNLTPHPKALGTWSYDDFVTAMKQGLGPDGTRFREPMTLLSPYAQQMKDVELRALWTYLQSLPAIDPDAHPYPRAG
jgi:cytochrome c553